MSTPPVHVETYSGYKADEYPKRFRIGEDWYDVVEIEDRWYGPGYSYFRVFADNAQRYILKHRDSDDGWEAEPVRQH